MGGTIRTLNREAGKAGRGGKGGELTLIAGGGQSGIDPTYLGGGELNE